MNAPRVVVHAAQSREALARNLTGFERRPIALEGRRAAAVAVVVAQDAAGQPCFIITRRPSHMRAHAGQWALPGGRRDGDETSAQTALRETHEEIGVELGEESVLGLLDDYATRSGFVITPVVLWHPGRARMSLDVSEVGAAYEVPVDVLGEPNVPTLRSIPESDRPLISVPIAMLETAIHAPTAAILYQFWEVAVQARETRVAEFEQPVFAWR